MWKLPEARGYTNLNTAVFDKNGVIWFTGQNGIYGQLNPQTGDMQVYDAPRGRGPYGIATTPHGEVYRASLAGNHIARIDTKTGQATDIEPPTQGQGARRVWADSKSRVWVSEWHSGNVSVYEPRTQQWQARKRPGNKPRAYSVYVDAQDVAWLTDFAANAMDEHFRTAPFEQNLPVLMALLTIWYTNAFGVQTVGVFPYDQYLKRFPAHLQQLTMESNGKHVTLDGAYVDY